MMIGLSEADWASQPETGGWELLTPLPELLNEEIEVDGQIIRTNDVPTVLGSSVKSIQKAVRARKKQERLADEQAQAVAKRRAAQKLAAQQLEQRALLEAETPSVFLNEQLRSSPPRLRDMVSLGAEANETSGLFDHSTHNHYRAARAVSPME
eukprot:SAG22_NODE_11654_length_475_cov_1.103723_1_plen_152_part_01